MNLQAIKDQLQTIFDTVPAIIFYKDLDHKFVKVNKYFKDSFEFETYGDIIGHKCAEFFQNSAKFIKDDEEVIRTGLPLKTTDCVMLKGRDKIGWYQTTKIPNIDADGNIAGIIAFGVNITEYVSTKERLESLINNIEDTFVIAEPYEDAGIYKFIHGNKKWKYLVENMDIGKFKATIEPFIESVLSTHKTIELRDCHLPSTNDSDDHYYNFLFYKYNGGIAILGRQVYNTPSQLAVKASKACAEIQLRLDRYAARKKSKVKQNELPETS